MTENQKSKIHDLRREGYSVREIAAELSLPKSTVGFVVKDYDAENLAGDEPEDEQPAKRGGHTDAELGRLTAQLEHEREMRKHDLREQELDLERQQMKLKTVQAENERQRLEQVKKDSTNLDELAERDFARQFSREQKLFDHYEKLVAELMDNCQDTEWTVAELDEVADRADALREKIEAHCEKYDVDVDELAIYVNLSELKDYVEKLKKKQTSSESKVTVDLTDKEKNRLSVRWLLLGFDDEVTDDDETEEDDDDDEEDLAPIRTRKTLAGADAKDEKKGGGSLLPILGGLTLLGVVLSKK